MASEIPDYTVVLGVDGNYVEQLKLVLPTWVKHKPSLFRRPWVVFYDRSSLPYFDLLRALEPYFQAVGGTGGVRFFSWPDQGVVYPHDPSSRFGDGQRAKMLAGFVHVPAEHVLTPYWLKLDLDVVATGKDDWIRAEWFDETPAIIAHPWGYTKPAAQVLQLDEWADKHGIFDAEHPPLKLAPAPGSDLVRHKRIISWCGFFSTRFTQRASINVNLRCGYQQLPVPSQDGLMHYMARRGGEGVVRTSMKNCGWKHCHGINSIRDAIKQQETPIAKLS